MFSYRRRRGMTAAYNPKFKKMWLFRNLWCNQRFISVCVPCFAPMWSDTDFSVCSQAGFHVTRVWFKYVFLWPSVIMGWFQCSQSWPHVIGVGHTTCLGSNWIGSHHLRPTRTEPNQSAADSRCKHILKIYHIKQKGHPSEFLFSIASVECYNYDGL